MPTSNGVLICLSKSLINLDESKKDLYRWSDFYNSNVVNNIMFVDRFKRITMPYNFKLNDNSGVPDIPLNFNKTYEQICNERAIEVYNFAKKAGKKLYVLYSGGIDSTLVLISLFKNIPYNELKDILVISMNIESIKENPFFYNTFIKGKYRTTSSEKFNEHFDGKKVILGGEHNDQLFGSDIIAKINRTKSFNDALQPHNRDYIAGYFSFMGMSNDTANWWYDMLVWHSKQAPCEVKTNFDLLWWFNFTFKWQSVFFRILLRVAPDQRKCINQEFINNNFLHFYNTHDFQIWSMSNPHLKVDSSWVSYKKEAKGVILDFDGNQEYFDNKAKVGSLSGLFLHRKTPWAITPNFEYIEDFDESFKDSLYIPHNSFLNDYG